METAAGCSESAQASSDTCSRQNKARKGVGKKEERKKICIRTQLKPVLGRQFGADTCPDALRAKSKEASTGRPAA